MRLHVLGLPHTRTVVANSHCAFSMKVRRLAPMLAPFGYDLIHYGVTTPPDSTGWTEHVEVISDAEQVRLLGYDPTEPTPNFVGNAANVGTPLYQTFNRRLADLLADRVRPDDLIALPFGHGHEAALGTLRNQCVETGIGYPQTVNGVPFRIYESWAWLHWHLGRDRRTAFVSEWVAPNYFDVDEWPLRGAAPAAGQYVLYFGRLTPEKGLGVIWQLAKARPDLPFVLCGQGDPTPWLTEPNLSYRPPVHGMARAALMHGARCLLMPTAYVEPFGGVAVEAMLTGTPVLTSDHSAFTETVPDAWRCRTRGDWLRALDAVGTADPAALRERTVARYSLQAVGRTYDRILRQIPALQRAGWMADPVLEVA